MPGSRVVYQNWIVDLGHDFALGPMALIGEPPIEPTEVTTEQPTPSVESARDVADIRRAVAEALAGLSTEEREFVEQFYYLGRSYREISERTGRAIYKLEALHKRAIRKLKGRLHAFVRERFGIEGNLNQGKCALCASGEREAIDQLIANRDRRATWRPVLAELCERYGIIIRSPQVLIGHEKYHGRIATD